MSLCTVYYEDLVDFAKAFLRDGNNCASCHQPIGSHSHRSIYSSIVTPEGWFSTTNLHEIQNLSNELLLFSFPSGPVPEFELQNETKEQQRERQRELNRLERENEKEIQRRKEEEERLEREAKRKEEREKAEHQADEIRRQEIKKEINEPVPAFICKMGEGYISKISEKPTSIIVIFPCPLKWKTETGVTADVDDLMKAPCTHVQILNRDNFYATERSLVIIQFASSEDATEIRGEILEESHSIGSKTSWKKEIKSVNYVQTPVYDLPIGDLPFGERYFSVPIIFSVLLYITSLLFPLITCLLLGVRRPAAYSVALLFPVFIPSCIFCVWIKLGSYKARLEFSYSWAPLVVLISCALLVGTCEDFIRQLSGGTAQISLSNDGTVMTEDWDMNAYTFTFSDGSSPYYSTLLSTNGNYTNLLIDTRENHWSSGGVTSTTYCCAVAIINPNSSIDDIPTMTPTFWAIAFGVNCFQVTPYVSTDQKTINRILDPHQVAGFKWITDNIVGRARDVDSNFIPEASINIPLDWGDCDHQIKVQKIAFVILILVPQILVIACLVVPYIKFFRVFKIRGEPITDCFLQPSAFLAKKLRNFDYFNERIY